MRRTGILCDFPLLTFRRPMFHQKDVMSRLRCSGGAAAVHILHRRAQSVVTPLLYPVGTPLFFGFRVISTTCTPVTPPIMSLSPDPLIPRRHCRCFKHASVKAKKPGFFSQSPELAQRSSVLLYLCAECSVAHLISPSEHYTARHAATLLTFLGICNPLEWRGTVRKCNPSRSMSKSFWFCGLDRCGTTPGTRDD